MSLSDWQGSSFVLATRTGKSEMIEDLGHLWPAAERMSGRACDPLDPVLIAWLEEGSEWLRCRSFTPVHLLTGFLGSGKTTLLKRLLADPALADTAVLINEFGEVGLDHHLVERIDDTMVLLQSGCLCCTVRGELADALRDLHSKRERGLVPPFTRVVIESTGLADPFPVLSTLKADPVLRHHFRPGKVITTVDAVNGLGQLDTYVESNRQVAIADRMVITKADLCSRRRRACATCRTVGAHQSGCATCHIGEASGLDVGILLRRRSCRLA